MEKIKQGKTNKSSNKKSYANLSKEGFEPSVQDSLSKKEDKEIAPSNYSCWGMSGSNELCPAFPHYDKLKSGFYKISFYDGYPRFIYVDINTDELIRLNDFIVNDIVNEVNQFWKSREEYQKYKLLHKRGYLLYGIAGGGKTCAIEMLKEDMIKRDGLILSCDTHPINIDCALRALREIEPLRPVMCVFEDLDTLITTFGEDKILSLLDGESQVEGVINIATTNYPENLPPRIKNRPRRFDRVLNVGIPNETDRKEFLIKKLNLKDLELAQWVEKTEGLTFASLTSLIVEVRIFNKNLDEAIIAMKSLLKLKVTSDKWDNTSLGF